MEVAWRCPTGTGPNPSRSCPSCSRNRPITTPGGTRWKRIPSRAATSALLAATLCVTRSQSYSRPLRMARTLFFSMRSVRWHGAFGLVFLYFSVCVWFFSFVSCGYLFLRHTFGWFPAVRLSMTPAPFYIRFSTFCSSLVILLYLAPCPLAIISCITEAITLTLKFMS